MTERDELADYFGKEVVVETDSAYVYLGTLEDYTGAFITLRNVDVHHVSDLHSTKEFYIMRARQFGIQPNRTAVRIRRDVTISLSLLSDVIVYD